MPFFLKHHFDPDFNHLDIKPKVRGNERVDHLNRDYVQNVVIGQILAELIQIADDEAGRHDPRFILEQPVFPVGANTEVDPGNVNLLLAAANGYVYYDPDERISVKTLLNVRRDVDYATGNISFVGDVVVHGSVRSGFKVKGRNILVKGTVEAASLDASQSIRVEAGIKGDKQAELKAKNSIKVKFCENALISAGKNVLVESVCLHCKVLAGNALAVGDRLIGGEVVCGRLVRVGAQLGGGVSTTTTISLGYDPFLMQKINDMESTIRTLKARRESLGARNKQSQAEAKLIGELDHKLSVLEKQRFACSERISASDLASCAVIVPGQIRPGVELSIGQAFLPISDSVSNVNLTLRDGEIEVTSPAEPKKEKAS
ncbi:FapA family protein [Desulfonatronum sp. SC1]|uniref:FapA family protein n=1 Tax=Desulfonatronum sp. SC1 TaxID=2109626 RepID=UPI000D31BC7B|nr:FapA family protein [Desulfonatronum sp. SC1]PTN36369.1 DUF342 domain-containing protein [Desulfonatronum sp. SC1]